MSVNEQDVSNIMILNSQGYLAPEISVMVGIPYYLVLKVIKQNGGVSRKGRSKSSDGSSNKEQVKALWDSGLQNTEMIAKNLGVSRKYVVHTLNVYYNTKTRATELPIDYEAEKIAKRQLEGELKRGEISNLAKKFKVSRQFAHQRVNRAVAKLNKV